MRIHLLSDLHLESAPYALPAGLECDVVVAAGDIGVGTQGVAYLTSLPWPVVYVPGNHEYYPGADGQVQDYGERLAALRAAAKGTNVHLLEGEAVVIGGTRFVGATLWSDFGGANDALAWAAERHLRDYEGIGARGLNNQGEFMRLVRRFNRLAGRSEKALDEVLAHGLFTPAHAYGLHRRAVRALRRHLARPFDGDTVVVTHHAPSYAVLRETGIQARALEPAYWRMQGIGDTSTLATVAGYASDLDALLREYVDAIALWCHGHLHVATDIVHEGVRIVCNPRGRVHRRISLWNAAGLDHDAGATTAPAEQARATDSVGFQSGLVLDLRDGLAGPLRSRLAEALQSAAPARADIDRFGAYVCHPDDVIRQACEDAVASRVEEYKRALRPAVVEAATSLGFDWYAPEPEGALGALGLYELSERVGISFADADSDAPAATADIAMAPIERMLERIEREVLALPELPMRVHARVVRALVSVLEPEAERKNVHVSGWVLEPHPRRVHRLVATLRIDPPGTLEDDASDASADELPLDVRLYRTMHDRLQAAGEPWARALDILVLCEPPPPVVCPNKATSEMSVAQLLAYAQGLALPPETLEVKEARDAEF
jgi:hypothetical protein